MKLYYIFPTINLFGAHDARAQKCLSLISTLVFDKLRQNGDHFQYAIDWRDPGSDPEIGIIHEDRAQPHVLDLREDQPLQEWIRLSIDPNIEKAITIRSIASCRAVTFGQDGQAFLCLRHEDPAPVSPDPALIMVEERPDILLETDFFDGWLRSDMSTP